MEYYSNNYAVLAVFILYVAAVFLVSRYVSKLKWPVIICLTVLSAMIVLLVGPKYGSFAERAPVVIILAVGIIMLLVMFFRWLCTTASLQASVNPAERNRILKMVEEGKISADEGKELFDAMGKSSALRGEEKFTRVDIVIMCGVGLVVLGFFLPWVYISMSQIPGFFGISVSGYQAGYHTGAVGWSILIIAVASVIPVFVTPSRFLYKISMLQIFLTLIGLIIVISVLVPAARLSTYCDSSLGAGLFFCLAGFITAFLASIAKMRSLAA
jgi:hypothetical protein